MVAIHSQPPLSHRCDSHAVVYTSPYPPDRKYITRGKWTEAIPDLEVAAGAGLVLSIEVSHQCSPFRCLHPIITAMCVCNRRVAARHPHVCVHSIHIPRQDGSRLYQPHDRKSWGKISIDLIMEVMEAMSNTQLFIALPGGRSWLFDPYGAAPDEDGKVDRGVVHRVAVRRRLSH